MNSSGGTGRTGCRIGIRDRNGFNLRGRDFTRHKGSRLTQVKVQGIRRAEGGIGHSNDNTSTVAGLLDGSAGSEIRDNASRRTRATCSQRNLSHTIDAGKIEGGTFQGGGEFQRVKSRKRGIESQIGRAACRERV